MQRSKLQKYYFTKQLVLVKKVYLTFFSNILQLFHHRGTTHEFSKNSWKLMCVSAWWNNYEVLEKRSTKAAKNFYIDRKRSRTVFTHPVKVTVNYNLFLGRNFYFTRVQQRSTTEFKQQFLFRFSNSRPPFPHFY